MERMRNALLNEFKKLNHEDRLLVLAFARQLVDANKVGESEKRLRRYAYELKKNNK